MSEESKAQHPVTAYRVSGISFCLLEGTVIVLDPNQGLYFQLSKRLGMFLQSLPEHSAKIPPSTTETRAFSPKECSFLKALANSKLVICRESRFEKEPLECSLHSEADMDAAADTTESGQVHEISVWGTLSELTQPPPPPSGGPTTGAPPL